MRSNASRPGQPTKNTCPGLPLYLSGSGKSHARNFGSVLGSLGKNGSSQPSEVKPEETDALPSVSGAGPTVHSVAYGLSLKGQTDADFSNDFETQNGRTRPAHGCEGCEDGDCVRATGILVSTFQVTTTVSLPSVDDFPDLTPCQQHRVQSAITGVLSPHEQRHVRAFHTYDGTVRKAFNLKVCQGDFDAQIKELHDGIATARKDHAQSKSDALDPFNFDVDLNCEEPPARAVPAPPAQKSVGGKDSQS